jgi:hypothetical protein
MSQDIQYTNLKKAVQLVGKEFIYELTQQLISADKVASGKLISSLDFQVVNILDNLMIRLVAEPYLINVDKGRKPGRMPPTGPIKKWIEVRKIKGRDKKTGRFISNQSLAFAIAKGIQKNGIRPTNVIKQAKERIIKNKTQILAKAAQKDALEALNKILVNL